MLKTAGTAGRLLRYSSQDEASAERIAAAPGKPFPTDWEVSLRIAAQDGLLVESSPVAIRAGAISGSLETSRLPHQKRPTPIIHAQKPASLH